VYVDINVYSYSGTANGRHTGPVHGARITPLNISNFLKHSKFRICCSELQKTIVSGFFLSHIDLLLRPYDLQFGLNVNIDSLCSLWL